MSSRASSASGPENAWRHFLDYDIETMRKIYELRKSSPEAITAQIFMHDPNGGTDEEQVRFLHPPMVATWSKLDGIGHDPSAKFKGPTEPVGGNRYALYVSATDYPLDAFPTPEIAHAVSANAVEFAHKFAQFRDVICELSIKHELFQEVVGKFKLKSRNAGSDEQRAIAFERDWFNDYNWWGSPRESDKHDEFPERFSGSLLRLSAYVWRPTPDNNKCPHNFEHMTEKDWDKVISQMKELGVSYNKVTYSDVNGPIRETSTEVVTTSSGQKRKSQLEKTNTYVDPTTGVTETRPLTMSPAYAPMGYNAVVVTLVIPSVYCMSAQSLGVRLTFDPSIAIIVPGSKMSTNARTIQGLGSLSYARPYNPPDPEDDDDMEPARKKAAVEFNPAVDFKPTMDMTSAIKPISGGELAGTFMGH